VVERCEEATKRYYRQLPMAGLSLGGKFVRGCWAGAALGPKSADGDAQRAGNRAGPPRWRSMVEGGEGASEGVGAEPDRVRAKASGTSRAGAFEYWPLQQADGPETDQRRRALYPVPDYIMGRCPSIAGHRIEVSRFGFLIRFRKEVRQTYRQQKCSSTAPRRKTCRA